ncbi:hypothetical protein TIFTF001_008410 [Ficus carica]|uniref:Phosphoglycerate kinase n=1 Tax=Ficus carica TaxID=3494 RepID=A0AA87ZUV3_FICCA|nr:hypothetical protein TIFTF001_008410 [Ficus carica]
MKENQNQTPYLMFDSTILLGDEAEQIARSAPNALLTIKYLHEAGAKVILVSDWSLKNKSFTSESVADFLSSALNNEVVPVGCISLEKLLKTECFEKANIFLLDSLSEFKEEVANCLEFSEALSFGVDIFVNDTFSQSHKILASTVGVTRFCYACLAGFHFEEILNQLRNLKEAEREPYVAIIGGGNLLDKAAALHFLACRCKGLVFVGMMAFQIMHALGLSVPSNLVERGALKQALDIVQFAQSRNVNLIYPQDFWCKNDRFSSQFEIFPSHGIMDGWEPVDIGPVSLDEIKSLLTKCKINVRSTEVVLLLLYYRNLFAAFVLSIHLMKIYKSSCTSGESKLAQILNQLSQSDCDVTVVGNMACEALINESSSFSVSNMVYNASVVWEFLKGRKLSGVIALDRVCLIFMSAYPFDIDWNAVYVDPSKPLLVDIGSGNGLFLLGMARRRKDLNYLGLEMNKKLVRHCLDSIPRLGIQNVYFIATNATSAFRSIVSSYPGKLTLASIQCPNPDFNNPEYRWRMLQRSLVEAIVELLTPNGKDFSSVHCSLYKSLQVFLQSDVEAVSLRMKEEFLKYGKGKLIVDEESNAVNSQGWLKENLFGVRSDWEQHVLDRGAPMYRLMLSKSTSTWCQFSKEASK